MHRQEISAISDAQERYELLAVLDRYAHTKPCDRKAARTRAEELHSLRFGVADAAHAAYAVAVADVFISCDDTLLKKCRTHLTIPAMSPVEFCIQENVL